mmetsp:Transcript_37599/g.84022  ORF Transcript_37599/g.84022 Transcript_37599/m.84022 type:complete len:88 (+) Transcript_37599:727-990(+)
MLCAQTYNYAVCTVAAVTPALVWKAFDNSRKIREAEKKRVTSAIDNLETMRDEWMDVQVRHEAGRYGSPVGLPVGLLVGLPVGLPVA